MYEIVEAATIENIGKITDFINEKLLFWGCAKNDMSQIDIAIDEICSNVAQYAYTNREGTITVQLKKEARGKISITFIDQGKPYNPLEKEDPDITLSDKEREIGGLGIFITKQYMDNLEYCYQDNRNILKLEKTIEENEKSIRQWVKMSGKTLKRSYLLTVIFQIVLLFMMNSNIADLVSNVIDFKNLSFNFILEDANNYLKYNWPILVFFYLSFLLLYLPTEVGYSRYILNTVEQKGKITDIVFGLEHRYWKSILTYLLSGFHILAGLLCFIIPGIILYVEYEFVGYVQAQMPELSVIDTLKVSRKMSKGKRKKIFWLNVFLAPFRFLGRFTKKISNILLINPYYDIMLAYLFIEQREVWISDEAETKAE